MAWPTELPGFTGTSDPLRRPDGPPSFPTPFAGRDPHDHPGPPLLTQTTFLACCAHYPGGPIRAAGYLCLARSRARFFRIDSAFPASAPGRRHIGPFEACSSFTRVTACQVARPPFCGLCREVPTRPVPQPSRSPAIESNHQLFEWVLPPLVICPFRAHAEARPTRPNISLEP